MENKRRYPRIRFTEPVVYQRGQQFPFEGSVAEDISELGLRLSVGEFIPLNSALDLKIRLPGEFQSIPLSGKVVWVKETPYRDDRWNVGVELISDEKSSSVLKDYVELNRSWEN